MSSQYVYVLTMSFASGIVASDLTRSWWLSVVVIVLGCFVLTICFEVGQCKRFIQGFALSVISMTVGSILALHAWENFEASRNSVSIGVGSMQGVIDAEPDRRENGSWYVLDTGVTRIRIFTATYPSFEYGDHLSVSGEFELPEMFSNEAGIPFDYPSYLATAGITHLLFRPKIELLERPASIGVVGTLINFKASMSESIARGIESPQADLVIGMLLGIKRSLGEEILLAMQKVGLVHLVVLSGFNVSIIILALKGSVSPLPKVIRVSLILALVAAFVVMIGASASVVRAAVMASVGYVAESFERPYNPLKALFIAAACMAALDPLIVLHDPGFQLSFLATVGVILLSDPVKRCCIGIPERLGMRDAVAQTISAQTMTLPVILSMTGSVSLWSVPANALVVPLVAPIMLFGALAMGTGFVSTWLQIPFASIASLLSSAVLYLVDAFARL